MWSHVQIEDLFPGPAGNTSADKGQDSVGFFFPIRAVCQLALLSARTPGSLSVELLPRVLAPGLYYGMGLFHPGKPTVVFVECHQALSTHFSSLSTSLWMAAVPSSGVVCRLTKRVSCPIIQVVNEDIKQWWFRYWSLKVPASLLAAHWTWHHWWSFCIPSSSLFFFFFLCLSSTYQPIAYQLGDKETEVLCLAKGKMHNIWGPFLVPCIIKRNGVVRHDLPLLNPCWLLAAFPGTVMRLMGLYLLSWTDLLEDALLLPT